MWQSKAIAAADTEAKAGDVANAVVLMMVGLAAILAVLVIKKEKIKEEADYEKKTNE